MQTIFVTTKVANLLGEEYFHSEALFLHMAVRLNNLTASAAFLSGIFFVIGTVGYADQRAAIENVPWFYSSSDADIYFGLRVAYTSITYFGVTHDAKVSYDGDNCKADFCDDCLTNGNGTLGLLIVAIIFATITCALSGLLVFKPNSQVQMANFGAALISLAASVTGFGIFMGGCYGSIANDDDDDGLLDLEWGNGAMFTLTGVSLMALATSLQVTALCMSRPTAGMAANQA